MRLIQEATPSIQSWALENGWDQLLEVPCRPEPGLREGNCFDNVRSYVEHHGGSSCLGHMFVLIPGQAIQSEAHAVWVSPVGDLVDVTENGLEVPQILFAPDEAVRTTRGISIGEYLLLDHADRRVRWLFEFERGIEQWKFQVVCGIERTNSLDELEMNFDALRTMIEDASNLPIPNEVIEVFVGNSVGPILKEFVEQVPQDIREMIEG